MDSRQTTNVLLIAILIVVIYIAYTVHHAFFGNFAPTGSISPLTRILLPAWFT